LSLADIYPVWFT